MVDGVSPSAIRVDVDAGVLNGDLAVPDGATGLVVFAHGSGSSRLSPRNRGVAAALNRVGLATLLFDLLTDDEEVVDRRTRELRFDIPLLGGRLVEVIDSVTGNPEVEGLRVGLFGASTGAAAALSAAADRPGRVDAVVSRGGRPDLAGAHLPSVQAPTLLIVGERDAEVLALNRRAKQAMHCEVVLSVVPGAGHLFEEPGAMGHVARLAAAWFQRTL